MYQKQEIIVKKNKELMARYAAAMEQTQEMSDSEAEQFMKEHFTEEEMALIHKTENAHTYLSVMVGYYLDVLRLFENFRYKPSVSFIYGCETEEHPYVTFKTDRQENEDEIRVVIEEFWNNRFESQCGNPLMEDGISGYASFGEVPKAVRLLYKGIDCHQYLQREYSENLEHFEGCLIYHCIGRYYDECPNGEGAISVYDHDSNKYERFGYGRANYGWSGELMTGSIVDKSVLAQNPDKVWYAVNPQICWKSMDSEHELLGSMTSEMFGASQEDVRFPEPLNSLITEWTENDAFDDGTEIAYTYELKYLWEEDCFDNAEWEQAELSSRCNAAMTGAELLALLENLEHANKAFIKTQKKICEVNGLDYAKYGNENFCNLLLFHSEENEVLFAETSAVGEDGVKNGEIVLHCRKF